MNNYKIDFQKSKTSTDGSIMSKIIEFHNDLKLHDSLQLNIYVKPPSTTACDREVEIVDRHTGNKRKMLMFGSNSYINATNLQAGIDAAQNVIKEYGIGSGGVPLLSGTTILQNNLECQIAKLKGFEDSMLFSSGFTANLGVIVGLIRPNNLLIYDKLNHASLIDGAIMSGAKMLRYKHNDMSALEKIILENKEHYPNGIMIVTDGVFSMDGDVANLPKIIELANQHNCLLLIDDAHATGVIGQNGAGSLSYYGIESRENIIVTGTLSKALGSVGGFIAASKKIIDYLRVYARSNMYSTSLPPSVCASVSAVIDSLATSPMPKLAMDNAKYLRERLSGLGVNTLGSQTPIVPVIVGDEYILTKMANDFYNKGIFVNYIFPPVVSPKLSRLRISVMSTHTKEDIDFLVQAVEEIFKKYELIK